MDCCGYRAGAADYGSAGRHYAREDEKKAVFWSFNGLLSLLLFGASVYFNHFGSVPTYLALYELHQVFQVKESVESTIEMIDYLFFWPI
ncbi:hypothetical protein ACFTAO_38205 [Paenibacillus rhizoplanae]